MSDGADLGDLMALDMEYRLTIAHRVNCECAPYLARRREVLIPAVLEQAQQDNADPLDTFAAFARRLHAQHGGDENLLTSRLDALLGRGTDRLNTLMGGEPT